MWDYLTQFWDSITGVVVDAGNYSVEWFQNVGNAVAGAIGGMFEWLTHYVNDFFIFFGWVFSILKEMISVFTLPIFFIFNFLKSFTISAFSSPITPETSYSFSSEIMAVFNAIPLWGVIASVLGTSALIVVGIGIFKIILQVS